MKEVKVYSLVIPLNELEYWIKNDFGYVLKKLDIVGFTPDPKHMSYHLIFKDIESRKEAYEEIKRIYPNSLIAFNIQEMYIDSKYLRKVN